MNQATQRIQWLDTLKAITMLFVVFGHMWISKEEKAFIYSFHMPLFFAISGASYYLQTRKREYTFGEMLKNKAEKLLLPYFIWCMITLPIWWLNYKILGNSPKGLWDLVKGILYINEDVYSGPSNALWFLPALFLVSLLFYLAVKYAARDQKILTCEIVILGIVGYIESANTDYSAPWNFLTIFTAIVFFYVGYTFIQNYHRIEKWVKNPVWWLEALVLIFIGWYLSTKNVRVSMHANKYGSLLLFYSSACCTGFAIAIVSINIKVTKVISLIGRNTLIYLALHCPMLRFLENYSGTTRAFSKDHPWWTGIVIYVSLIPICFLIEKYLPELVGRKRQGRFQKR